MPEKGVITSRSQDSSARTENEGCPVAVDVSHRLSGLRLCGMMEPLRQRQGFSSTQHTPLSGGVMPLRCDVDGNRRNRLHLACGVVRGLHRPQARPETHCRVRSRSLPTDLLETGSRLRFPIWHPPIAALFAQPNRCRICHAAAPGRRCSSRARRTWHGPDAAGQLANVLGPFTEAIARPSPSLRCHAREITSSSFM